MKQRLILSLLVGAALGGSVVGYRSLVASDHDDGENDVKSRALNLTDHGVWVDSDNTKLNMYMTVNPRSLGGFGYGFSTQAKYRFNVTRAATRTSAATGQDVGKEDIVYEFTFQPADAATGVQAATLSVYNAGTLVGTGSGSTTPYALSKKNTNTINSVTIGGTVYKFFAGQRQDTFFFDVQRYFQVRSFLAQRFIANDATATLPPTCDNWLLGGAAGPGGGITMTGTAGDPLKLFNPKGCAPDFTKGYNNSAIVLQIPIASMQNGGTGTVFDTWSTISIPR